MNLKDEFKKRVQQYQKLTGNDCSDSKIALDFFRAGFEFGASPIGGPLNKVVEDGQPWHCKYDGECARQESAGCSKECDDYPSAT